MVVVLIIAILIAIAVPTFLGARQRAQNASAKSSLRNAFANAKSIYTDNEDYTQATPAALLAAEPSLTFNDNSTASTGPKNVSVKTTTTDLIIVAKSSSGNCYGLKDTAGAPGTQYATVSGACTGDNAAATGTWAASW
jgi:type IV pilus assembly protein PilA